MSDRPNATHSKTDALLVKDKSISDGGRDSGGTYSRSGGEKPFTRAMTDKEEKNKNMWENITALEMPRWSSQWVISPCPYLTSFSLYFISCVHLSMGVIEMLLWAPGTQPGSTHQPALKFKSVPECLHLHNCPVLCSPGVTRTVIPG